METKVLVKTLAGTRTLKNVEKKLNVSKSTALKYLSQLKKEGFVKTSGGGKQPRFYQINPIRMMEKGIGYYETINKYSPIKLAYEKDIKIVGRDLSIEEVLVWAVKSQEFRTIIASLALFRRVRNWSKLYKFSKEANVRRKIGALYDLTRSIMKTNHMDKRIEKKHLSSKWERRFVIKNIKPQYFRTIEKKWNVFIPFNIYDLNRYKEV